MRPLILFKLLHYVSPCHTYKVQHTRVHCVSTSPSTPGSTVHLIHLPKHWVKLRDRPMWALRTAFCWVITQRIVAVSYRRFGTTCRSHIQFFSLEPFRFGMLYRNVSNDFFFFSLWGRRNPTTERTAAFRGLLCLAPLFSYPVHLQRRSTSERRESSLLAKGEIMGKKWPTKFSLTNTTSTYF
jgi:hypothetical protein